MKISVIPARNLDDSLVRVWTEFQQSSLSLASPYFTPEFTQSVAAVCDGVEVAVIEDSGKVAAFFPFQRNGAVGLPVGGILSDFQGLACAPSFVPDPPRLVRQCRLSAWDFDHLLVSQPCFAPHHRHTSLSPQMDLSGGYEAYCAERRAAGSEQIKKTGNLMRRIEREVGPLRFVAHSADAAHLQQALAWKSQQYLGSGKHDIFALGWTCDLVGRVHATQVKGFAGILSLLYAGDRLVAAHFGMRSRTVWHYWFPSYDEAMAKYSPGLILLLKMAEHAPSLGLRTIDLGQGMSLYKERLMNASVTVASGSVELPSWLAVRRGARRKLRALVVSSPLERPIRRAVGFLRQLSPGK